MQRIDIGSNGNKVRDVGICDGFCKISLLANLQVVKGGKFFFNLQCLLWIENNDATNPDPLGPLRIIEVIAQLYPVNDMLVACN